jgi:hypothetical protein
MVRSVQMHQPIGAATDNNDGRYGPQYKNGHCRLLRRTTAPLKNTGARVPVPQRGGPVPDNWNETQP